MKEIKYIKGDATSPIGEGNKILIHCCNSIGAWGAGFVMALSKKWKDPEVQYRKWSRGYISNPQFALGEVQFVKVEPHLAIGNMIGQEGTGFNNGVPPVRYKAVNSCLQKVSEVAIKNQASVHLPYLMCCDLAGGKWEEIEKMLIEHFCTKDIDVVVYDIKGLKVKE